MDASRFDALIRFLSSGASRRGMLAGLGSGLLATLSLDPGFNVAEGKKRKKKKKKKKKKSSGSAPPPPCQGSCAGKVCGDDGCGRPCGVACGGVTICQSGRCCSPAGEACNLQDACCAGLSCVDQDANGFTECVAE